MRSSSHAPAVASRAITDTRSYPPRCAFATNDAIDDGGWRMSASVRFWLGIASW